MAIREQINEQIETYAMAVRNRNPDTVAELFAESFDHIVHGLNQKAGNPWITKKETTREDIKQIYSDFFSSVAEMEVEYTNRIIDEESNSAAMVVKVKTKEINMENALHIKWNSEGKIIYFYNWYGSAPNAINLRVYKKAEIQI